MAGELSWKVDQKALSKKYRTDVGRLIRAWKSGLTDQEIAKRTGVNPATLYLVRQDIELSHRRFRLARKKQALAHFQAPGQCQIFFNPHL